METKPLLYGLAGFFIGGLLVATAATTFDKPDNQTGDASEDPMVSSLSTKTGDDYDKAFINYMIEHHQSAIDMARLSAPNSGREEIKRLSNDIISAQEKEIAEMRQWQNDWGYSDPTDRDQMNH